MLTRRSRTLAALLGSALAAAVLAGSASAADRTTTISHGLLAATTTTPLSDTSSNWAGYAATGDSFTSVTASWVQPTVSCASTATSYSSFWVGLGGFNADSQALEQIGTEGDCVGGRAVYSAWWEIVPAPMVDVDVPVAAGDALTATVSVTGQTVTMELDNTTTGATFTKTVQSTATPDVSSAEWIAEAPSSCSRFSCRVLPLANFGTVSFTGAAATGDLGNGTIAAPWSTTAIELLDSSGGGFRSRTQAVPAGAVPGSLSEDGSAFDVSWQPRTS
jgi:hypothetical protein